MTVDDAIEAIYQRLCIRQQIRGVGADMSLTELRRVLGVTEEKPMEAVKVARLSDDLFLASTVQGRVTLGASWRGRCQDEERPTR